MIRYFFIFILFIHALIHLIGTAKGFDIFRVSSISKEVSRTMGFLWLGTFAILTFGLILFVFKNPYWSFFLIVGSILSQTLIFLYWKDAKAGTIANIIILFVGVVGLCIWNFKSTATHEAKKILTSFSGSEEIITNNSIQQLPPIVQKWLIHSGTIGKKKIHSVRLKQKGMMRTSPEDDWMPAEAVQYFTVDKPAFVWIAIINKGSMMPIYGRDKYENGEGNMLIKVLSIFKVADAKGEKLDQGTLLRFLAEIEWFPSAATASYIKWEQLTDSTAKATMTYGAITASGIYTFDKSGRIASFEALRYKENNGNYSLEKWIVPVKEYKQFEGIEIPSTGEAIWDLKEGSFSWFKWEVTSVNYNVKDPY